MYLEFKNTQKVIPEEEVVEEIIEVTPKEENTSYELDIVVMEELLPIKEYNLKDLQSLSEKHGIEVKKEGSRGKMKNKTKLELHTELKTKLKH